MSVILILSTDMISSNVSVSLPEPRSSEKLSSTGAALSRMTASALRASNSDIGTKEFSDISSTPYVLTERNV